MEQRKATSLYTVLINVGVAVAGLVLIYKLSALIIPFLAAIMIAMTLTPEVDRLETRGIRRGFAIAIIYIIFLASCGLILYGLNLIASGGLSSIFAELLGNDIQHSTSKDMTGIAQHWMISHHVPLIFRPTLLVQAQHLPELLSASIPTWFANIAWLVIIPIITFFILLDFHRILGKLLVLAPLDRREAILNSVIEMIAVFGNYVRGVLIVMAMDISITYIVLRVAKLDAFAAPFAVGAGILYTIPYFGAAVSTAVIGLVALQVRGVAVAVAVTIVMIFIHQVVFDNIVAPRVIGKRVNLHPLVTLLALMAGGTLAGIVGTLLAVPVAAAIQIILLEAFPALKTDTVTIKRAERVVRATLASDTETMKPESRKDGKGEGNVLKQGQNAAVASAKQPEPILKNEPILADDLTDEDQNDANELPKETVTDLPG